MKKPIILIAIITIFSCSEKSATEMSGVWDISSVVNYVSDTISISGALAGEVDKTTVKTDSGIMVITHFEDSIISIKPTTKTLVLHLHFDDNEKGVVSSYEIDSEVKMTDEEPRWSSYNNNFWTIESNEKQFLVIDSYFDQFGNRLLDTVECRLIAPNKLFFKGDTLSRINEP
jgi:hypothetical protein